MSASPLTIAPRFNGPPGSANGGYSCGCVARFVDGPAEVTLRLPPPLGRDLALERNDVGAVHLRDGDATVAEGHPVDLAADAPEPVTAAAAAEASMMSTFRRADLHPFPTCFVCGPDRDDGLGIFAGKVADRSDLYAAAWTPEPELAGSDGTLPEEIVWAALDCPTSAPIWNDPEDPDFRPVVLARLAVRILAPVTAGAEHTIISWPVSVDGRKRHAGAALHALDGELLAVSRALWIELRAPPS